MLYGCLEIGFDCTKCGALVPLNGPWESAHCDKCQTDIDVPHDYWKDIIDDIYDELKGELQEGDGRNSTIFGTFNTKLLYGRLMARCEACKTNVKVNESLTDAYTYTCEKCGRKIPIAPAPDWFKTACQKAKPVVLVNAQLQGEVVTKSKSEIGPVAFVCPQCGGGLVVDGTERVVPCKYCKVSVYLPDDLWLRLHPAMIKTRWFIGFEE